MITPSHIDLLRRMAEQARQADMDVALGWNVVLGLIDAIQGRYFLFGWEDHERRGGVRDLVAVFDSLEEAKRADRPHCDEAHIATYDGGQCFSIVAVWDGGKWGEPEL